MRKELVDQRLKRRVIPATRKRDSHLPAALVHIPNVIGATTVILVVVDKSRVLFRNHPSRNPSDRRSMGLRYTVAG